MIQVKKKTIVFLIGLTCTIIFTSISQYTHISSAKNLITSPKTAQIQYNEESLTVTQNFFLKKYAENIDSKGNITSINIELPDTTWNITDLELNFTDIKIERELKTIEGNFTGQFKYLHKPPDNNFGYSVQLNILENTTIYGVYIYGYTIQGPTPEPIKVQIQGFDDTNHIPDGYNYISQELNISGFANWYFQNFSSNPITLQKGNYSLVLNGTNLVVPQTYYYWAYNNLNPVYPELFTSRYSGINWIDVAQNSPFLCKLYQKTDTHYNPQKINMTVEVYGEEHKVINGFKPYTGRTVISNKNFNPNDINLHIPIKLNKTIILNFSLNYRIKINENFISGGSLLIKKNLENFWIINPIFTRLYKNFSVEFEFPNNWKHLRVYKNTKNLTRGNDYVISGNTLSILNDTIPDGINSWEITANSTNLNINLYAPKTSFNIGENLGFYVEAPAKIGNYTFVLVDSIGEDVFINSKERSDSSRFPFNYTIPSNARSGEWTGFVFWNNATDAGVQTQPFQITGGSVIIGPTINSGDGTSDGGNAEDSEDMTAIIILAVVLIGGITSAVSISSYEGFKRLKRIRDEHRSKLHNQFKDLINLNYIMITEKKSGLNIFEKYIAGQEIDATLISGFLNAIRAFGIELTRSNDQSQTISLEYKDSKVLMSEFKNFRIIVIMKERPSEQMINSITDLSYGIENKYSEILENFKGSIVQFAGISDLIEEHLHTSFISPLKLVENIEVKLSISERAMINKVKELMKEYNLNYFHSTYLITEQKFKPGDVETILNLINKKIFQPTSSDSAGFKK
ncbi:MAG: hypothetical protein ACFFD2_27315 [Promethearchaeota archaeon]